MSTEMVIREDQWQLMQKTVMMKKKGLLRIFYSIHVLNWCGSLIITGNYSPFSLPLPNNFISNRKLRLP